VASLPRRESDGGTAARAWGVRRRSLAPRRTRASELTRGRCSARGRPRSSGAAAPTVASDARGRVSRMRGGPTPDACDGGKARSLPRLRMEVARLPFIHGITVYLPDLCEESKFWDQLQHIVWNSVFVCLPRLGMEQSVRLADCWCWFVLKENYC
jgi:hypothetical protein